MYTRVVIGLAIAMAVPALSQDWGTRRDPCEARTLGRYHGVLKNKPHDRNALKKLRKCVGTAKLIKRYDALSQTNNYSASIVLYHLHRDNNDIANAAAVLDRVTNSHKNKLFPALELAKIQRGQGQHELALRHFQHSKSLAKKNSDKEEILRAIAEIHAHRQNPQESSNAYSELAALSPKSARIRLEVGDGFLKFKNYPKALLHYEKAEKLLRSDRPRRVEVIARIGHVYDLSGQPAKAIESYEKGIQLLRKGYYLRKELITRIVDIHRRKGSLPEYLTAFKRQHPPSKRGFFEWDLLAQLHAENGDQNDAIKAYEFALKKSPHEIDTHRRFILLLETLGHNERAIRQYERVTKIAPGNSRLQLELATRYYRLGKTKKAFSILDKLGRRFARDPGTLSSIATLYEQWGQPKKSLKLHETLTKIAPTDPENWVALGQQYLQRGQKEKALQVWSQITKKKDAASYARLGKVLSDSGLYPESIQNYQKAIEKAPKNAKYHKHLAGVLNRAKKSASALKHFESYLTLLPQKPRFDTERDETRSRIARILTSRAMRHYLSRKKRSWQQAYQSGDREAGLLLIELYIRERNYSGALQVLERFRSTSPKDVFVIRKQIRVNKLKGNYEQAVALLLQLATLRPQQKRTIYNEIAELKAAELKDEEAIEYSRRAVAESADDPAAHERLAQRYLDIQKFDKAVVEYETVLRLAPRNYNAAFALARLYRNQNKPDLAIQLYRKTLRNATETSVIETAGRHAISLEELSGSLGELEKILVPLAFTFTHKPVYRRMLTNLYGRYVPLLLQNTPVDEAELSRVRARAATPLLQSLRDDSDPREQQLAIKILTLLRHKQSAAALMHAYKASNRHELTSDTEQNLAFSALVAAAELGEISLLKDFQELFENGSLYEKQVATFAFTQMRTTRATQLLERALVHPNHRIVALGCMGIAIHQEKSKRKQLLQIAGHEDEQDTTRALCLLAAEHLGPIPPKTLESIADRGDAMTRNALVSILGRSKTAAARKTLFRLYLSLPLSPRSFGNALAGAAPLTRFEAYSRYVHYEKQFAINEVLGKIQSPSGSIEQKRVSLSGEDWAIIGQELTDLKKQHVDTVLIALERIDSHPEKIWFESLSSKDEDSPLAVRQAIVQLAAPLLTHPLEVVRARALSVLSKTAHADAQKPLVDFIQSNPRNEKTAMAIQRLSNAGYTNTHFETYLVNELKSNPAWNQRSRAANILRHYPTVPAISALTAALSDEVGFVRQESAQSLASLRDPRALASLLQLSQSKSDDVRLAAVLALKGYASPQAVSRLRTMAKTDPNPKVRRVASSR